MSTQAFGALREKCLNRCSGMKGDSAGHRTFSSQLITVTTRKQHACFHSLYGETFDLSSRTGLSLGYLETKILHCCGAFLCQTQNATTCHTPKRVKRWKVLLFYSGTFCLATAEMRKKINITCTSLAFKRKQCGNRILCPKSEVDSCEITAYMLSQ